VRTALDSEMSGAKKRIVRADRIATAYLQQKQISGGFLVIPVPNSSCVATSSVKPHTRKLAKAICDTLEDGSKVLDCLRWKKNLGSASEECGPREAEILYGNLTILEDQLKNLDEDANVLLVDDVTTSGGHLKACAAKLKKAGISVDLSLCGGKTIYDQNQRAFSLYEYTLDEHKP
jgi:predicted amidophosphoribosyltransferase